MTMLRFVKYSVFSLLFLSVALFYLLSTSLGNQNIYDYISYQLTQKADLNVTVTSINIDNYPYASIELNIEKKARFVFNGYIDSSKVDMNYTIISQCIATAICKIDDNIDIKGHIKGKYSHLQIDGIGKALDGNISYSATKFTDKAEDLILTMRDINSSKLLALLGQDALIRGKANIDVNFTLMQEDDKQGYFSYDIKDNNFSGIPLNLNTTVYIDKMKHSFTTLISAPYMEMNISNGEYDQSQKIAKSQYILDILDLSKLETLLGDKYKGRFYARGEIGYNQSLYIQGLSKSYGGILDFYFKDQKLKVKLDKVSFSDFMSVFPYPQMLKADTYGDIVYDFDKNSLKVDTKLKNSQFLPSQLVSIIYEKSGVNMLLERFDDSSIYATYQDSILLGDIKISNDNSHVFITSIKMDSNKNTVNAYFDFDMQQQAFSGKIYGLLKEPKVNLNMQRLIRYQMNKQLDSIMGKNTRKGMGKMMDSIPMANMAESVATETAASFIGMFF